MTDLPKDERVRDWLLEMLQSLADTRARWADEPLPPPRSRAVRRREASARWRRQTGPETAAEQARGQAHSHLLDEARERLMESFEKTVWDIAMMNEDEGRLEAAKRSYYLKT